MTLLQKIIDKIPCDVKLEVLFEDTIDECIIRMNEVAAELKEQDSTMSDTYIEGYNDGISDITKFTTTVLKGLMQAYKDDRDS